MPFVYIIYSAKLGKYYVGACTELERRIYEHNIGHSKFTRSGIPWVLKYTERYDTLVEAKRREQVIKKQKSRKYLESLIARKGNGSSGSG
jgi:putative endonuclease